MGTALIGKRRKPNTQKTNAKKNEQWIHVDSRNVKEIWVQVEVVKDKALVKVWKKDGCVEAFWKVKSYPEGAHPWDDRGRPERWT